MDARRVLSGLSYFSIFFAAFLFPLVVFFATDDARTKVHAKRALLSHLLPFLPVPLIVIGAIMDANGTSNGGIITTGIGIGLTAILGLVMVIWNIVQGVKALQE